MFRKSSNSIDAAKEAGDIYSLCGNDLSKSLEILEKHLNVLQVRAQVLMSLASVVLTITGFSGSRIAGTNSFAKFCVLAGLTTVLLSAIWIWRKVLSIKWITSQLSGEPIDILTKVIGQRNDKTRAYMTGGFILCAGFVIYSIAFMNMLLFSVN